MDEQFEFLRSIVHRLEAAGIPYMLTGSLALAVWARPRMTRDVDIVIEADHAAVARLLAAFAEDSYASPEVANTAVTDRTMFNVIHLTSLLKADFILRRDEPFERTKFDRRRSVDVDGLQVTVISPEDLILSKLQWASGTSSARMTDTSPAVEAHLRALYQSRSPGQRLRMATAMFASAKRLALAGLVYEDATRNASALRMALLQRLHGEELSLAIRATVASRRTT